MPEEDETEGMEDLPMKTCENCKYAGRPTYKSPCSECKGYSKHETVEIRTNGDRIRAMSDEELAKWLLDMMSHKVACFGEGAFPHTPCRNEEHDCVKCGIEWLKQPVEEV